LDQLYITVLSSAPRQDEFMPILYILLKYGSQTMSTIAELLGVDRDEITLLLHGLHSVIEIPSDIYGKIAPYHASFLDFLNNPSRSQKFYAGSLENRMHLGRCFLHFA
ncbi:hypothetical protein C8R45DRAFT_784250, partial [Mycena sanguinolenta]